MVEDSKKAAIEQAIKILKDAEVEYWFFPILMSEDDYECFVQYPNFHVPNEQKEKTESILLNLGGLCHIAQCVVRGAFCPNDYSKESSEKVNFLFWQLSDKYNKYLRDIDVNFTGKYDEKGEPIRYE